MQKRVLEVLKTWYFPYSAFWSAGQWGGYSPPPPPPPAWLRYCTGNNLYKAETDPENFARGGARGNITAGGHVLNAIFASFYVCLG